MYEMENIQSAVKVHFRLKLILPVLLFFADCKTECSNGVINIVATVNQSCVSA